MESANADKDATHIGALASRAFLKIEVFSYLLLGLLLAFIALLGIGGTAASLWDALQKFGDTESLAVTIDRLLLVLMVVEILHTVRQSFRSGSLVCEPFLVVGLIASIRRVLVVTIESAQVKQPGKWTPDSQALFNARMLELAVLAGLILVMVISIYMLRHSQRHAVDQPGK
ncbi:MAG: phosphate-starvation-inducible PsiE family protein [Methylovirgula sp.]